MESRKAAPSSAGHLHDSAVATSDKEPSRAPPEGASRPDASLPSIATQTQSSGVESGRIRIDLDSGLCRRLSRLAPRTPPEHPPTDGPPAYSEQGPRSIRLNVVVQVVGSRGDVQPFVALGRELQRHGHRVRLATHDVFARFVRDAGLDFFPVGGDPAELMAYMVQNPGLIPGVRALRAGDVQRKRRMVAAMLRGFWSSCVEPDPATSVPFVADAIIANPPSFAHVHCAQALGVPLHLVFTMPWTSTTAFCHPLANLVGSGGIPPRTANYLSYLVVEWLTWQGLTRDRLQDVINSWRKTLDLEPVPFSEGPGLAETLKVPVTYCWSPALVPRPADWPSHIDVCGFFFRDEPEHTPTPGLAAFLSGAKPIIYIGFGSIVVDDPRALSAIIVGAVEAAGVRAVVSRGWSGLGEDDRRPSDSIFYLDDCPHEWLFARVSAVVHHGGAGTTACGLLHGRPTAIVPFFGDQPFWGAMVASAGAGPPPIPARQLSVANLAAAIRFCLTPEAAAAAAELSAKMSVESGVRRAVATFHANLPLEKMRCDLLPNQPAAWLCTAPRPLKLSKAAAEILTREGLVTWGSLKRYKSNPIHISHRRWDPVTATASSLAATGTDMVASAADIVIKPVEALGRSLAKERRAGERQHASPAGHDAVFGRPAAIALPESTAGPSAPGSVRAAALGSAAGVGNFVKHFYKGMLLDVPLAVTEGMRNAPRLYGGDVYDPGDVVDWKTGGLAAGRNLSHGFVEGFRGLVMEPIRGAEHEGAVGAARGAGVGLLNFGTKVSSGALGLVAYSGQGLYQSLRAAARSGTSRLIKEARRAEGPYAIGSAGDVDAQAVARAFRAADAGDVDLAV
ncbi:UDP-glucose,sterol transferase [Purpureocillium lavendulum]|uniref:UDP-glucose,sterol transferase n=1 Tax=Purpureocillium lavendulum TaxID=1247861 RepID=A0AB34FX16_9HYPO|nr:UDP-glucose,sterol transferase [Purpureocillium lavendulum]